MRVIPKESGHAFEIAFALRHPWQLTSLSISRTNRRFEVLFDYNLGDGQSCPFCGRDLIDMFFSATKTWSHLNFFQYETHMTACIPVFRCSNNTCMASKEREAILNTLFLDVLLMVSPYDSIYAMTTLLSNNQGGARH